MVLNNSNLIIDSRISPKFNCNRSIMDDYNMKCSNGDKWLFSIIMGMLFFIFTNSIVLYTLDNIINKIKGKVESDIERYPPLVYTLVLTVLFICIVRLILW